MDGRDYHQQSGPGGVRRGPAEGGAVGEAIGWLRRR